MFGRLADLYGRKKTFMIGSAWLAVFTLVCGFAKSEITLDILRGLQGVGVAASLPASVRYEHHSLILETQSALRWAFWRILFLQESYALSPLPRSLLERH